MLENKEGQRIPEVVFKTRREGDWKDISTKDIFAGKKVVVFSLPGAFTPTCSSTHLPRYNDLAPIFKENGIDEIVCLSVNDGFVMEAWGVDQEAENINLIPDGNGEFSQGMGMLVDKAAIGFGKRSWRYSMLVNDGVIEKMFIEPDKPGDPFEVSDADTMLTHINPKAVTTEGATVFSKPGCPHCKRAKDLLNEKNIKFTDIEGVRTQTLKSMGGSGTYPLVFLDGKLIGGADDLASAL
ncbi:MAG: glutathione peroxidase [Bacteriovoracaceae bacterium]|nr:glutathione peroxidase [Bacteriovoracaceae bacterium]